MLYNLFKYLLFRPICVLVFRPSVEGETNIPARGGVVIAGNHLSAGETLLLPAMIRRSMTFPAKAELFEPGPTFSSRVVAWFLKAVGQVPMDRSGGRASAEGLQPIMEVLENGRVVGIFPEGTRSKDGRLHRGRTGVARLALGARVPVVPVGFTGTEFHRGPFGIPVMRRPGIRFGKPIDFSEYYARSVDGPTLRVATDKVMAEIQKLTGQEYVDAYSGTTRAEKLLADGQVTGSPGETSSPQPSDQSSDRRTEPGTAEPAG